MLRLKWQAKSLVNPEFHATVVVLDEARLSFVVQVHQADLDGARGRSHAASSLVAPGAPTSAVTRKLDHFRWLRDQLQTQCTGQIIPPLPSVSRRVGVDSVCEALGHFLNRLMADPRFYARDVLLFFLHAEDREMEAAASQTRWQRAARTFPKPSSLFPPKTVVDSAIEQQQTTMRQLRLQYKQTEKVFVRLNACCNALAAEAAMLFRAVLPTSVPLSGMELLMLNELFCKDLADTRARVQFAFCNCARDVRANARAIGEAVDAHRPVYKEYLQVTDKLVKARKRLDEVGVGKPESPALKDEVEAMETERNQLQSRYLGMSAVFQKDMQQWQRRRQRNVLQAILVVATLERLAAEFHERCLEWVLERVDFFPGGGASLVDVPKTLTQSRPLEFATRPPAPPPNKFVFVSPSSPPPPTPVELANALSLRSLARQPPKPRVSFRTYRQKHGPQLHVSPPSPQSRVSQAHVPSVRLEESVLFVDTPVVERLSARFLQQFRGSPIPPKRVGGPNAGRSSPSVSAEIDDDEEEDDDDDKDSVFDDVGSGAEEGQAAGKPDPLEAPALSLGPQSSSRPRANIAQRLASGSHVARQWE